MAFQQLNTVSYTFGRRSVKVLVPDRKEVAMWYEEAKCASIKSPDPYWTQVWPAALALCEFLSLNTHLIDGRNILELAAGLGLPSLWASHYARSVICSDYLLEAVAIVEKSKRANDIQNLECQILDWNNLPHNLEADVLLLSDINYELAQFEQLLLIIEGFIKAGTAVILSTPQRLVAKSFIERLLPMATQHEQANILDREKYVSISVLVLLA